MCGRQWHPTPVLLPGKSHGRRSLVGCGPRGREESDTTERLHFHFSLSCIGEGNGNPLQCSCLENPRDGGAWWAAISGVAQNWTRLKQLSSSSKRTVRWGETLRGEVLQGGGVKGFLDSGHNWDPGNRGEDMTRKLDLGVWRLTAHKKCLQRFLFNMYLSWVRVIFIKKWAHTKHFCFFWNIQVKDIFWFTACHVDTLEYIYAHTSVCVHLGKSYISLKKCILKIKYRISKEQLTQTFAILKSGCFFFN